MATLPSCFAVRLFAGALLLAALARGQVIYTGNTPDFSGSDTWGIANNWSTATVPTSTDTVEFGSFFNHAPHIGANSYSVAQLNFTGTSDVTIFGSGTLTVTTGISVTSTDFFSTPVHTIAPKLALGGASAVTVFVDFGLGLNLNGIVSGSQGLTKTGAGTLTLNAANTYSGTTTINAGTLVTNTAGTIVALDGAVVINSGGTLRQADSLSLGTSTTVTVNSGGSLDLGSGSTKIASVTLAGGNVTGTGDTSRLVTNGLTTSASTTSTWNTTLSLGASAGSANTTITTATGSTLTINGTISDGALVKTGAGTLVLSSPNTFSGGTTVNAGKLVLGTSSTDNNLGVLGAGNLTLDGGTLGWSTGVSVATEITLGASGGTFELASIDTSITGNITGTGALNKTGSGNLTLSGNNTYGGATTLSVGNLILSSNTALPATSAVALSSGTTLRTSAEINPTFGALSGAGNIVLGLSSTLTAGGASDSTFSGAISDTGTAGSGAFTKTGSGTLTLSGALSYDRATTINAGTLVLGASNIFSTANRTANHTVTVNAGTLNLGGFTQNFGGAATLVSGNITNGTLNASAYELQSGTINATLSNATATVTKNTTGTVTLAQPNTYRGATVINAGTLTLTGSATLGNTTNLAPLSLNGGTLDLGTTSQLTGALTLNAGNITNGTLLSSSYTVQSGAISAALTGTGIALNKTGSGTVTLSGTNTYTGTTAVNGGTLALSGGSALADTTAVTLANATATTLTLNASETIGSLAGGGTLGGNVALGAHTLTTGGDNTSTTFSGVISGTGALVKTGTGNLTLAGTNTYSGGTTINAGSLIITSDASLGAAGVAVTLNGGRLRSDTTLTSNRNLTLGSSGGTLDSGTGATLTLSGNLTGTGALSRAGTGNLILSGTNTYAGATNFDSGPVTLSGGSALPDTTALTLGNNTTSSLTLNASETIGSLAGGGTLGGNIILGSSVLTTGGANTSTTYSGALSGAGGLTKTGTGTLTLSGNNTYNGTTTVSGGNLVLTGNIVPSGAYALTGGNLSVTYNGTLANSLGALSGTGTVTLGANTSATLAGSTHTGSVVLNSGSSLTATGNLASTTSGAGTVSVTSSTVLTGALAHTGGTTVSGTLTIGNGGTTGSLAGNLTGSGTLTFNRTNAYTHAGDITVPTLTQAGSGPVTVTGNVTASTFDVAGTGGLTLGNVTTSGNLTKTGTGNLTFTGAVSGSVLNVSGAGSRVLFDSGSSATLVAILLGANTTLRFAADNVFTGTTLIGNGSSVLGTTLDLNGTAQTIRGGTSEFSVVRSILLGTGGALTVTAPTSHGYVGAISGAGSLTKTGSFPVTIVSASPYTGPTTITAGTLNFARRDALNGGDTSLWTAANFTVASGATAGFSVGGSTGFTASDVALLASLGTATGGFQDGTTLALDTGSALDTSFTLPTSLTNPNGGAHSLSLTKIGNGLVTLSGANSYTGTTTVTAGTLHFATRDSLYGGNMSTALSKLNMGGNGTIGFNVGGPGEFTAADMSTLFPALTAYAMRFDTTNAAGGVFTLSPTFSPSYLNFTKAGPGTLIVTQPFNGHIVTISEGTLQLSAGMLGASGSSEINNAGTLVFDFTFSDSVGPHITGSGSVVKNGSGTLVLASTSFTGGLTLNAGTLLASANNQLGAPSGSITFGGGTLRATTGFSSNRPTTLATGGGTFNVVSGQTLTWDGAITGAAGNHLTKIGAGELVLGGANTYAGDTNVNAGTLTLAHADAFSPNTKLHVAPGATFNANGHAPTVGELSGTGTFNLGSAGLTLSHTGTQSFSGTLTGAGGFTKSGAGTLTLSGTHTHTGPTTLNAGRIHLTGTASGSAFTIKNGAILSGSGTLGALTLQSGAILSPGNSPGTLSSGATTWEGGSSYLWEINRATGGSAGADPGWDLLSISGALTITANSGSRFTVNLTTLTLANAAGQADAFDPTLNYSFNFVTATGGITGFNTNAFTLDTSNFQNAFTGTWSISSSTNALSLNYTASAIPEPSTYAALAGLACLALAALRRRK